MKSNLTHNFEPIYNEESRILILGTFPSVKSREAKFYYHHPKNRFWKIISSLMAVPLPETVEEKKAMLLQNHIAVWDVIHSCDIKGSSDSSIQNVVPNDIAMMLNDSNIESLYANGGKAYELYYRYCYETTGEDIIKLPSTSPANAACSLEKLIEYWGKEICPLLGGNKKHKK